METKEFRVKTDQLKNPFFLEELIRDNFDSINWIDSSGFMGDNIFYIYSSKDKGRRFHVETIDTGENTTKLIITEMN